jgi:hypothetical protein
LFIQLAGYEKIALDADLIAFQPKVRLNEIQIKAVLAYLNSVFNQFYIEMNGRVPSGIGPLSLEIPQAKLMPIPDVRKISPTKLKHLAKIFDEMDLISRCSGGLTSKGGEDLLESAYKKLNSVIASTFGFDRRIVNKISQVTIYLMDRRLLKKENIRPEVVSGEDSSRIK